MHTHHTPSFLRLVIFSVVSSRREFLCQIVNCRQTGALHKPSSERIAAFVLCHFPGSCLACLRPIQHTPARKHRTQRQPLINKRAYAATTTPSQSYTVGVSESNARSPQPEVSVSASRPEPALQTMGLFGSNSPFDADVGKLRFFGWYAIEVVAS